MRVGERDAFLVGSACGVAALVSVALRVVQLALERSLGIDMTALLVLAQAGVAGYGLAMVAWVAGRGATMIPRSWVVATHGAAAVALAACALVPGGRPWTVPALGLAAGLAGAGVATGQLVRANVLERLDKPGERRSALARTHAWMTWVSAPAVFGVALLAEHSWRLALMAMAIIQGSVALAHVRRVRLPHASPRRARGFEPLRRPGMRRALGAQAATQGCWAVMHGLLAVLLRARGFGPLAAASCAVVPVLIVSALVHRLGDRAGAAPAAATAIAGYAGLAASAMLRGHAGLVVIAVAVFACQLGGHLMAVGIADVVAAEGPAAHLTSSIANSLVVAGVGLTVATCYDQARQLGLGTLGIAATLAALAVPLIGTAAWGWARSLAPSGTR